MEDERTKKRLLTAGVVVLALVLPVALAGFGGWRLWQERQARQAAQVEFNEALRQSLERAADVVLPVPTLGEGALVVECPPDKFEGELQRVVRLAKGVGGTASSWNDGETVRIVANVPRSAESMFSESVERGVYDLQTAGDVGAMTVVEVVLRPVEPKPTVKPKPKSKKVK
jgi:type II secretory pathway pseudopilin PulG